VGSRTLAQGLMRHGLVDLYRLMLFPVTVGSGWRLFAERPEKTALRLLGSRSFASGAVELTYAPAGG